MEEKGLVLDPADERHAKAIARLRAERIGWLGTIGRDGYPHAVPVWFLWHDDAIIVFNQPGSAKVKNLRENPRAFFHLEAGADTAQVHVLQGDAEVSDTPAKDWATTLTTPFLEKYALDLQYLGQTLEELWSGYSVVTILRPRRLITL
ncbi:pyridoxamine 5'-phosphate oxidase family protein [Humibacter sp.]|uniref:pyridoxamine 5'-phosphate oxidase family protein n=1 Tax=Humibacter sp. TaxID=1940291 RepID=UPI003F81CF8F